jgi:hypothetical protein
MTQPPASVAGGADDLEAALGWTRPAMHGVGWVESVYVGEDDDGEAVYQDTPGGVVFTSVNTHSAHLAAAAVADVVGYRGGSGSYPLTRSELDAAAELLAQYGPSGPDRRNLDVRRDMLDAEGEPIYVFVGDPERRSGDPYVNRLVELIASGRPDSVYGVPQWWPAAAVGSGAVDAATLAAAWAQMWPESLPIAHELKETFEDEWVRFHGLPGSKRYPETDAEYAIVLDRHNTLLADLCAAHGTTELIVLAADVASTPAPTDAVAALGDGAFIGSVPWHYADPCLLFAHLYAGRRAFAPGALDEMLRAVADGDLAGVIIAPADLVWLYHPYDGGADVIAATVPARDDLAKRYADWRSAHPSGL